MTFEMMSQKMVSLSSFWHILSIGRFLHILLKYVSTWPKIAKNWVILRVGWFLHILLIYVSKWLLRWNLKKMVSLSIFGLFWVSVDFYIYFWNTSLNGKKSRNSENTRKEALFEIIIIIIISQKVVSFCYFWPNFTYVIYICNFWCHTIFTYMSEIRL